MQSSSGSAERPADHTIQRYSPRAVRRSSGSAEQFANHATDSSAEQPADHSADSTAKRRADHTTQRHSSRPMRRSSGSAERPADEETMISTSLCLFARLPLEVWRQLVGLLSFSDVAACSCSTSHEDTKWLLTGYMKRRCCVSTFKRLLAHYGAIIWDPDYGEKWDTHFWNGDFMRKEFWRLAIEMIFLYEPKMLQEGQRCDRLIQQDYIHSCGILFASEACSACSAQLQRQFRQCYGAPNHIVQPWFINSYGLYSRYTSWPCKPFYCTS